MPDKDIRPADGGSYRRSKDGKLTRLDKPQTPDPGKTARRKAAEQAQQSAGKTDTAKAGKEK
jgi:hypothetical protein